MTRILLALATTVLFAVNTIAFQAPPGQGEFVPITELPPGDRLPAAPLLVIAYAFVWLALMFYLWTIWRRLGKVEREMRTLTGRSKAR